MFYKKSLTFTLYFHTTSHCHLPVVVYNQDVIKSNGFGDLFVRCIEWSWVGTTHALNDLFPQHSGNFDLIRAGQDVIRFDNDLPTRDQTLLMVRTYDPVRAQEAFDGGNHLR